MTETEQPARIGFIGLGVMGEPICRNLALKSGATVHASDRNPAPVGRLLAHGVQRAADVAQAVRGAHAVFLSLPSGAVVSEVVEAAGGLLDCTAAGQIIVDLGTSPVDLTRDLARRFAERGAVFVDAPVARTRAAAQAGTLSVMVGAEPGVFARIQPWLATFASDITLCGPSGCGQIVKLLNNMVLFETVMALSEAKAVGERAGVDPTLLFDTLAKGSADSFALRNHGMKAMLPGDFPERAFSVRYAAKDLAYALALAQDTGIDARGARLVQALFEQAEGAGIADRYFPVISTLADR